MNRIMKISTLLSVVAALAAPSAALAGDPGDTVYNPGSGVKDVVASGTPTPSPTPASGVQDETTATPKKPVATAKPQTSAAPATPASTPVATTEKASSGSLPFTGFEAGFVALAGLALLGGGLAMRRASRTDA